MLRGYTIGVTADRRSEEQIALLEGRGAECVHGPTIRTHALLAEDSIHESTKDVIARPPDAFVALTGIGVRGWFEAATAFSLGNELLDALSATRSFARGPKAHGAATTVGLDVEWVAQTATAQEVFEHVCSVLEPGASIVVQNDGAPGQPLADRFIDAGFDARGVAVYRWSMPTDLAPAEMLVRSIIERRTDAVTFTSAPAIEHLQTVAADLGVGEAMAAAFAEQVLPVCVGPITAARAEELGFGEPMQPVRPRLGAMVQQLTDALTASSQQFDLAGRSVELRGRLVQIDGCEPVRLAVRERSVLLALLERPGVVRSKDQLLDTVWGSRDVGAHVVEVTVGRLRRRLGPAGEGIETVIRRGYRASAV